MLLALHNARVEMQVISILFLFVCFTNVVYPTMDSFVGHWTDGKDSLLSLVLTQNSEAELICPTNVPMPNITFLKDGQPFTSRPHGKINKVKNGIKLPGVLADYDKGNYTCIIQTAHTNMSRTFVLDIIIHCRCPPEFISVPENKTVKVGDDVELVCRYISGEATHVTWLKHYNVNGSYSDENGDLYFTILKSGTLNMERLTLHNVTTSDVGWYTCVVNNRYGQIQHSAWIGVLMDKSLTEKSPSDHAALLVAVSVAFGVFAVVVAIIAVHTLQRRRPPKTRPLVLQENSIYYQPLNLPVDPHWEISRTRLQVGELLGEGAFGKVHKGYVHEDDSCMQPTVVAVKMLKDGASESELADLLREMEMMKSIGQHHNIINLLGCCTQNDGPVLVIVEYAPNGNLRDYLRQRVPSTDTQHPTLHDNVFCEEQHMILTYKDLVSFAYQVARGMEYLASMKIVHRDLAARNVLVGNDNRMKIADFGLTRNVNYKGYYRRTTDGRVPVKWMAPESLRDNEYTVKSDIWSYGILLWEIFSYGSNPYPSVQIEDLFQLLKQGRRMEKPFHASDDIYETMLWCWRYCPHDRPEFVDLVQRLDRMVSESVGTNYLNLESLPDANQDTENEEFNEMETDRSLLIGATTPHGSDSQYASLTSSEPPSSPERSVKSFAHDSIV